MEHPTRSAGPLGRLHGWLARRPSYMLLNCTDERLAAERPGRFRYAWAGLTALSLGWGVVWVALWGGAWALVREPGTLFAPAAVTLAVMLLWPYRRAAGAVADLLAGEDPAGRSAASAALAAALALCLLALHTNLYHSENILPPSLSWVRPAAEAPRVLLLMPSWGGWAMLIGTQFVRPKKRTPAYITRFARGCGPLPAVLCMALPAGLSALYFHFMGGWELVIIGVSATSGVLAVPLLAWRTGGLSRRALLGANLLTQFAFVLSYLAVR